MTLTRRRVLRLCLLGAAAVASASRSLPARAADGTGERVNAAQALFDEGRALVEDSQFAAACPKFAESERLDPGIGTQLWLADCYENLGQLASAWASFKYAEAAAASQYDRRERVARLRAAALEPRLPRVIIVVADAAAAQGIEVRRDGVAVGPAAWGVAVPVDPGEHTVAASASGREPWSTTLRVRPGADTFQVIIPALDEAPPSPVARTAEPAGPAPPARMERGLSGGAPGASQRLAGAMLAGAGAVGVGLGTFFSFDARSTYDASNRGGLCTPDNHCDAQGAQDRDQAKQKALVASVAIGAGAAAALGGVALYLLAPKRDAASVAVTAIPLGAALSLRLGW